MEHTSPFGSAQPLVPVGSWPLGVRPPEAHPAAGESAAPESADALVIVPTYNEKDNLEIIVARLREAVPGAHVLVVDDNSPDGTGLIADRLAQADPRVHALHREEKNGLGGAYLAGFAWARERGYDVVVEMDADGSHDPQHLPDMLAALQHADLVLGSRWVPGGAVVNWPKSREVLSRGGNAYTRIALGMPLRDATGGYRAYRRAALDEVLGAAPIESQGYCFQVDLARRFWQHGMRVLEVPITFVERERGESKMSQAIVIEALWRVTVWGLTSTHWRRAKALRRRQQLTAAVALAPA